MAKPYTYLITAPNGKKYYGVRYSMNCCPEDLWVTYFTHSKEITRLIEEFGKDSFLFEVRKVFSDPLSARMWENKVLRRLKIPNEKWINKTNNMSIPPMYGNDNPSKREDVKKLISEGKKGKKRPDQSKRLLENHHMKNPDISNKVSETRKRLFAEGKIKSNRGMKRNDITGELHHFYGKERPKLSNMNMTEYQCPHCDKVGKGPGMKRYHFDKCKLI